MVQIDNIQQMLHEVKIIDENDRNFSKRHIDRFRR